MQISELTQHPLLDNSDHNVITFKFNCYLDYTKPIEVYAYARGDYKAMRNHLANYDWAHEYTESPKERTVEEMWDLMKSKLLYLRNQFIPKQTNPSWKDKGTYPISKSTRQAMLKKNKTHRQWMAARRQDEADNARHQYTKARNKLKSMLQGCSKKQSQRSQKQTLKSHTRRKLKTQRGVAPLMENEKDKISLRFDDKDKASILQKQFSSIFTHETDGEVPSIPDRTDSFILDMHITEGMVIKKQKNLNANKSCGPDNIHARLLLELADLIAAPITVLFNMTMQLGLLPSDWKCAIVSPIYKKGSRSRLQYNA